MFAFSQIHLVFSAVAALLVAPFRGKSGAPSWSQHALYAAMRTLMSSSTVAQQQWLCVPTDSIYLQLASSKGFQPDSIVLSDGAKAHWMGRKSAKKILLYFHGLYSLDTIV